MTVERMITIDAADLSPSRVDRVRLGRPELRPPISAEDIEATRAELAELRRRMTRRTA